MTLNKARTICRDRDAFTKIVGVKKWNDIYNDESEILEELKHVNIPPNMIAPAMTFKGYAFIYDFAKRLQSGQELTEKQIVQVKRLAKEIKKAYLIREYQNW